MRVIRAIAVSVAMLVASAAHGGVISSMTMEQLTSFNGYFGGNVSCRSNAAYDAQAQLLAQSAVCLSGGWDLTMSLAAVVNNSGDLQTGYFSMYGRSEELGIDGLIASGRLLEVFYGGTPNWGEQPQLQTLIGLDFAVEPLQALGPILYWQPNAGISVWQTLSPSGYDTSAAWTTSAQSDFRWTGSQWYFYDRNVFFVSEPGVLTLLSAALGFLLLLQRRWSVPCRRPKEL